MSLPQPLNLISNMVAEINQRFPVLDDNIVMVGIHTGGAWIAQQLFKQLSLSTELGLLDISFYRDDFSQKGLHPKVKSSELPDIEGKTIILVDDVIMSGRTIRAAMNELFDYGRPEKIVLACLIDVGQRELPIQVDIIGEAISRPKHQRIKLSGPEPLSLSIVTLEKNI
ncbi:MAG: pyrimidine operon attenuation protein/uracil phosphoribosyltransferase [Bermanella sp.]|jgi:pyrimidine operon attenuation protein/uracil phosphoribosyltransferase